MPGGSPANRFVGDGVDPGRWHMVIECAADGQLIATPPLDRPVLYKRGRPEAQ